mgnify:CR=1 FL=1
MQILLGKMLMIQITPHMRIHLAMKPADFRKGIDGLCAVCRNILKSDPFSGHIFVFRNKRKTAIKILIYDGQGFWLCQKRLSQGKFHWWPDSVDARSVLLASHELQLFIYNGNPDKSEVSPMWKDIPEHRNTSE